MAGSQKSTSPIIVLQIHRFIRPQVMCPHVAVGGGCDLKLGERQRRLCPVGIEEDATGAGIELKHEVKRPDHLSRPRGDIGLDPIDDGADPPVVEE